MVRSVGPRALPVYNKLREHILSGDLPADAQLPSHMALSQQFGVALMTVRQALSRLEEEGLLTCDHGRGTFVRGRGPAVLVVDDDEAIRGLLRTMISAAGHRVIEADGPVAGFEDPVLRFEPGADVRPHVFAIVNNEQCRYVFDNPGIARLCHNGCDITR